MSWNFLSRVIIFLGIFFIPIALWAQCATPVGATGEIHYFNDVYHFCNGTDWISTDVAPGDPCDTQDAGEMLYTSGEFRFCNGRNWRSMNGSSAGSCGQPEGTLRYNSSKYQFCNGTNWKDMVSMPPTPDGYIVRSSIQKNGNLTYSGQSGILGADAWCLDHLTSLDWRGKSSAGTLNSSRVKAFLCNGSTCNNLTANSVYAFAVAGSPELGGAWLTTDSNGRGPDDSSSWATYTYFGDGSNYWSGRASGSGGVLWSNNPHGSDHCNNWTNGSSSYQGYRGNPAQTTGFRWKTSASEDCSAERFVVCLVNP